MEREYAKHEKDFIKEYQKRGYIRNYRFHKGKLVDLTTEKAYHPHEIYVVAEHRYEGMSDPSDMAILYVLESKDGSKGTLLLGYGPAGDIDLIEFFKAIPKSNCSNKASITEKK